MTTRKEHKENCHEHIKYHSMWEDTNATFSPFNLGIRQEQTRKAIQKDSSLLSTIMPMLSKFTPHATKVAGPLAQDALSVFGFL